MVPTKKTTQHAPSEIFFGYSLRRGGIDVVSDELNDALAYEKHANQRSDVRNDVIENVKKEQVNAKLLYDEDRKPFTEYSVGDLVTIQPTTVTVDGSAKLSKRYVGPYKVIKKLDNDRYVIGDVPGYPLKQKIYKSILFPARMQPWVSLFDSEDEVSDCEELDSRKTVKITEDEEVDLGGTVRVYGNAVEEAEAASSQEGPSCKQLSIPNGPTSHSHTHRSVTRAAARKAT